MNAKVVWSVVIVLVVLAGGYYLYATYQPAQPPAISTGVATPTIPPPAPGSVVATTPTSITVATAGGGTRTFAISASTTVNSVVSSGEVGKSAAQLVPGTQVIVVSPPNDPGTALAINVPPPPPPQGELAISGSVLSSSATALTLKMQDGTTKKISITAKTSILTNVTAGQKGRTLSAIPAGSLVQVLGTTSNGATAAQIVLINQLP